MYHRSRKVAVSITASLEHSSRALIQEYQNLLDGMIQTPSGPLAERKSFSRLIRFHALADHGVPNRTSCPCFSGVEVCR
jgi:hypothetical protein